MVEENNKEELGVVYLESQKRKNNRLLHNFRAGNKKNTYFVEFLEIEDAEGSPIKVGAKFNQNNNQARLNNKDVEHVRDKLYKTSNKSVDNIKKRNKLYDK